MKRTIAFVFVLCLSVQGSAQPETGPSRKFEQNGTTKLRHGSRILTLAFSPDEQTLAAGGGNDPVRLWNSRTGELIGQINEPWVHAMTFTVDGKFLILGGYQKNLRIWDVKKQAEWVRLEGHKATIKCVAASADDNTSTLASGSQDGAIIVWNKENKANAMILAGHKDEVNALVFDQKDANVLISGGNDRCIFIWNLKPEKNEKMDRLKLDAGCGVYALALSADGKTLYSAGDDYVIRRWDVASGKQTGMLKGHEGIVVNLALVGDTLYSGSLDKTVRAWDVKNMTQARSFERKQGDSDALAVSKSGDMLATAGLNNTIRIYDTANFKEANVAVGIKSGLAGLALSTSNPRLVGVTSDGQIIVMDPDGLAQQREWQSKQAGDVILALSRDGKMLASGANGVRLWNPDNGDEIGQFPSRPGDTVVALAFSPDAANLAVGYHAGDVEIMSIKDKKSVANFKYPYLQALAWSPDGKSLAVAGSHKITLVDPKNTGATRSFDVKEGPPSPFPILIASLAFGPESKTLAAGGWDGVIRIYNLNAKNPTDQREHLLCEGHQSAVHALAFSPDGRSLVSGSFDKTVRLWEAFSGKPIAVFKDHIGEVRGVAFARNGRSVYSGAADTMVYRWDVPGLLNNGKIDGKLPDIKLTGNEIESAWTTLASEETPRGHEMMWKCIAAGKDTVPPLTKGLYYLDPDHVKKLFKDLDSGNYPTRQAAMNELTKYGRWMEGRYDAAMANPPSLEYKRRIEMLKEKVIASNAPSLAQERLRVRRIMLICEQVASAEAIEVLRNLAQKGPEEELREEAQASLQRLGK